MGYRLKNHTVAQNGEGETTYHQAQVLAREILPQALRKCNWAKLP